MSQTIQGQKSDGTYRNIAVDNNGNLGVSSTVSASTVNTPGDGRKTVTTAGTAEALSATSLPVKSIAITALSSNTNVVVVGASTVVASAGTRRGTALSSGDSLVLDNVNLNAVFVDVLVNGEGVTYTYLA